ncbi:hypothetical protein HDU76_004728 [Blyttiomyces sp. JEL0837]|nr:hypothetical protein HDU76_004728 [Blyttiomyces sp. JEL0837]
MTAPFAITLQDVQDAHDRIRDKIGAFKIRGAMNALICIPQSDRSKGVVTHSSGNHAQAVALAARSLGIPAKIVMPKNAPIPKLNAVRGYGADVVLCEPTQEDRERTANQCVEEMGGATFVHPYNNPMVMAGQGTLMVEFLEQVERESGEGLDAVVIPVGGGGMLAGCCVAGRALRPGLRIFAAEPKEADDVARGFRAAGGRSRVMKHDAPPRTVADGLLTTTGELTWPIIKEYVEDVFTVTEEQIIKAMKHVFERMKLVIEPSAAVGVAVVLYNEDFRKLQGIRNVGIVLCGGAIEILVEQTELRGLNQGGGKTSNPFQYQSTLVIALKLPRMLEL